MVHVRSMEGLGRILQHAQRTLLEGGTLGAPHLQRSSVKKAQIRRGLGEYFRPKSMSQTK